nr:prepilin-type N-terminal cleavage/methylation domain-containing protein [Vibrio gelatinilyticus]
MATQRLALFHTIGKKDRGVISKQNGFSLLEVSIALSLIAVGALGLLKMQVFIEQRALYSYQSLEAMSLAQSKMDWFRNHGDATVSAPSFVMANFDTSIVDGQDDSHPLYLLQWEIANVALLGNVKTVQMTAHWSNPFGPQKVELKSQISRFSEY